MVEVLIVVVVLGIIAAVATPNFLTWLPNMRLKAAARDLYSTMQSAKLEAIKRNQNVVIVFNAVACPGLPNAVPSPGGGYLVFVDDGAGGGLAGNNVQDGAEITLVNNTMPANVALCTETYGGATGFTPRGLLVANNIGTITFNNDQNNSYQVATSIAGRINLTH